MRSSSLDWYATMRSLYRQKRKKKISGQLEEEIKNTVVIVTDGEELTEEEEEAIEELVDAIIEIQETVDFTEYEVEEETFEINELNKTLEIKQNN